MATVSYELDSDRKPRALYYDPRDSWTSFMYVQSDLVGRFGGNTWQPSPDDFDLKEAEDGTEEIWHNGKRIGRIL